MSSGAAGGGGRSGVDEALKVGREVVEAVVRGPSSDGLRRLEHWIALAAVGYVAAEVVRRGPKKVVSDVLDAVVRVAEATPGVGGALAAMQSEALEGVRKDILGEGDPEARTELPAKGISSEELVSYAKRLLEEMQGESAKGWGGVYYREDSDIKPMQAELWRMFSSTNALYPGLFRPVRKFEAEMTAMAVNILHPTEGTECGILSSGGTESVFLAIKALRERAIAKGMRLSDGLEVIAGVSAHPAMDKACEVLGLHVVKVPVRASDQRLDPATVRSALTSRTICIYTSAPSFPHGVVDPIPEIAALGLEHDVPVHVDNCLGGILLSFMEEAGEAVPSWDFRVPGVTTISMDIHKYGMASKGASIVAFRDASLRRRVYSVVTDWQGGLYVTHTAQGSRSGAVMAAAWGTLLRHGRDGYTEAARHVHSCVKRIRDAIPSCPGLRVLVNPDACVVSFTSDEYSILDFADYYKKTTGRTLAVLQNPAAVHVCVAERWYPVIDEIIADIRAAAQHFYDNHRGEKPSGGTAGIYGASGTLPPAVIDSVLRSYPDICLTVKKS